MDCKHCGETFFRKVGEPASLYCPTCVKMYKGDVEDGTKPPFRPTSSRDRRRVWKSDCIFILTID